MQRVLVGWGQLQNLLYPSVKPLGYRETKGSITVSKLGEE
jgi:hypothetical protein